MSDIEKIAKEKMPDLNAVDLKGQLIWLKAQLFRWVWR